MRTANMNRMKNCNFSMSASGGMSKTAKNSRISLPTLPTMCIMIRKCFQNLFYLISRPNVDGFCFNMAYFEVLAPYSNIFEI